MVLAVKSSSTLPQDYLAINFKFTHSGMTRAVSSNMTSLVTNEAVIPLHQAEANQCYHFTSVTINDEYTIQSMFVVYI